MKTAIVSAIVFAVIAIWIGLTIGKGMDRMVQDHEARTTTAVVDALQ